MERPKKRVKLLDDSDSEDSGVSISANTAPASLKVNEEFAKRFEHNKKREELQRCMSVQCISVQASGLDSVRPSIRC